MPWKEQTIMEQIFRMSLFIVGAINFLPSFLAFFPENMSESYGIEIPNTYFDLLLSHRGVMLGIIGGLMMCSAIAKKYYSVSVVVGMISMISFVLFFYSIGSINPELKKVMRIDIVAILILVVGFSFFKLKKIKKAG